MNQYHQNVVFLIHLNQQVPGHRIPGQIEWRRCLFLRVCAGLLLALGCGNFAQVDDRKRKLLFRPRSPGMARLSPMRSSSA